ncbi:hypothetical protein [Nostoc sp. PA-18-2419]|uniref:hypothetical protein n=1 Tax=Nostoc sp. PA-18-2419 TaxID=2575443 RepID=UPI00294FFA1B|nr:hypothetical protein [Nostoc sp. PA-18-2419]
MTFINTQNVVINISYIAAVRLDNQTLVDKKSVSVLLATLQFLLFKILTITNGLNFLFKQLLHSKSILPISTKAILDLEF